MNDNELLHLAAKAARIELRIYEGLVVERGSDCVSVTGNGLKWNPLEDDGDAFRLMVSLRLCVAIEFDRVDAITQHECATEYFYDNPPTDPYAATRRAVVGAAAAIGKEMP